MKFAKSILSKQIDFLPLSIGIFFLLVFAFISIPNHMCFRTHALDLGMFNQALYQYSIGEWAVFSQSVDGQVVNYLSDHFSPIIILLSPLRYLFGTYTLLFIQLLSLAIGAVYCHRISLFHGFSKRLSSWVLLYFFSLWGLYAAFAYDFHANVVGSLLVFPFVFYALVKENKKAFFFLILILLCKESLAIFLALLCASLAFIEYRKTGRVHRLFVLSMIFSFIYLIVITVFVMPSLNTNGLVTSVNSSYGIYGQNMGEVFVHVLSHPWQVLSNILLNSQGELAGTKMTTLFFVLLCGGFLLLIRPIFLLIFIPLLGQKFLSANTMMWDIHKQYSIEICVALSLLVIFSLIVIKKEKIKVPILILLAVVSGYYSVREIIRKSDEANIFGSNHYTSLARKDELREVLNRLSTEDVISVSSNLSPHLSFRSLVYAYPQKGTSSLLVLNKQDFQHFETQNSSPYEVIFQGETIALVELK